MKTLDQNGTGRHPIRVVAERTGLSTDVLRAWEKRYGVVDPVRSDTGQRLYSDADVERLLLLRRVTDVGRSIGLVAELSTADLRELVAEDEAALAERERVLADSGASEGEATVEAALRAVQQLDAVSLEGLLMQAAMRVGAAAFLEEIAAVLLQRIGDAWHRGELTTAGEHMATAVIRRVLGWMLWTGSAGPGENVVVVATPAGQVHEMGAMLCAAAAVAVGWRVMYLGADLPAVDIARAAREAGARAVALSLVYPEASDSVADEIRALRWELPEGVALIIGGSAAESYGSVLREVQAVRLRDLAGLRSVLTELERTAGRR